MKDVSERIAVDNEKNHEEEVAKAAASASQSGDPIVNETSAETTDMVDISAFAQNAAAFAPTAVPEIPVAQAVQIGEIVDVKA